MTAHDSHRPPAPPSDWVRHCAKRIAVGGRVLDLACGRGRHTRLLLEQGFAVVAVDRDVSGLADIERQRCEAMAKFQVAQEQPNNPNFRNYGFDSARTLLAPPATALHRRRGIVSSLSTAPTEFGEKTSQSTS